MAVKKPKKKQSGKLAQPKRDKKPAGVTAETPLKRKQARFVEEYLKDFNGQQAAIRTGYSPRSARAIAAENLTKPHIAAAIQKKTKERTEKAELSAADLLFQIKAIATSNIRKHLKFGPGYVEIFDSSKLTPEEAACVSEVQESTSESGNSSIKFKLHDKLKAIDMGMKYLGLYAPEKRELSGEIIIETGVRRVGDED